MTEDKLEALEAIKDTILNQERLDARFYEAQHFELKYKIEIDPLSIHVTSVDFNFNEPPFDPIEFSRDLCDTMLAYGGLGLAACQIGQNYRIFAIRGNPMLVMYNPTIVAKSENMIDLEEGCLSFPGIYMKIRRPDWIRIRYTEPNGNVQTRKFEGLSARIIQHEYDHIDAYTMFDRAHKFHKEAGLRKLKQLKRKRDGNGNM